MDGSTLIKADTNNINNNWYDYDNQKWANMVLVTDESREAIKLSTIGTQILEDDILAYYTYIPRYKYLLWNANNNVNCLNNNCNAQEIKIEFENKSITKSSGSTNGEWLTHPAFTFGATELNGIWVGKFTTSAEPSSACYTTSAVVNCNLKTINPRIKPNVDIWRYIRTNNMYKVSQSFTTNNLYGIANIQNADSHMMKNIEWGALAYLSHSKYGKYGNESYSGENKQIYINNYRNSPVEIYRTGCSSGVVNTSVNNIDCPFPYPGQTIEALGTSTTGNIYGVYDMSGGVWESVMGQTVESELMPLGTFYNNCGLWDTIPELKYYDSYAYSTTLSTHERGRLGDATKEIVKTLGTSLGGWYGDVSSFPHLARVWFIRGGYSTSGNSAGVFNFNNANGNPGYDISFRVVLNVE